MPQLTVSVELVDLPAPAAERIVALLQQGGTAFSHPHACALPGRRFYSRALAVTPRRLRTAHPGVPVVAVAACESEAMAVAPFRLDASNYLSPPVKN